MLLIIEIKIFFFAKQSKWNHGNRPKSWVNENQDKITQVFLMLKLPYTKSGAGLLKTDF